MSQVAQVARLDAAELRAIEQEVLGVEDWMNVYSEYHTGGWLTLSLLNNTSRPADATIDDCVPVETSLLARMPRTRSLLLRLGLKYMWVRLAKLEPNAFLWEHRDYQELLRTERHRLHIPIITNASSALIVDGFRVHLAAGYIWRLNPSRRHGACNFGKEARVHLLIDCYGDAASDALFESEWLDEWAVTPLPEPDAGVLAETFRTAERLARLGYETAAEILLLKTYHSYRTEAGGSYDLVVRMFESLGRHGKGRHWRGRKAKFLGLEQPS